MPDGSPISISRSSIARYFSPHPTSSSSSSPYMLGAEGICQHIPIDLSLSRSRSLVSWANSLTRGGGRRRSESGHCEHRPHKPPQPPSVVGHSVNFAFFIHDQSDVDVTIFSGAWDAVHRLTPPPRVRWPASLVIASASAHRLFVG